MSILALDGVINNIFFYFSCRLSCPEKCFPIIFNQLFPDDFPACQNSSLANCYIDQALGSKYNEYLHCLKPQVAEQYKLSWTERAQLKPQENQSLELEFVLGSDRLEYREEVLIVSGIDFVSNLGGSLGLFIGFSFYNFIAELLGKCIEKVIKN